MTDTPHDAPGSNRLPPLPGEVDADELFAHRVREVREALGLTQRQVAERMTGAGFRMHQTTVAKIEAGDRPVYVGEVVALAGVFEVDISDLVHPPQGRDVTVTLAKVRRSEARVAELRAEVTELQATLADRQARLAATEKELQADRKKLQQLRGNESRSKT